MAKMGRKPIEINVEEFEKLCALHCTLIELAAWFRCSPDTIENWCKRTYNRTFSDVYHEKKGLGNISLRRKQMECALNGNITMLIWLGKQYLDQAERIEQKVDQTTQDKTKSTQEVVNEFKSLIQAVLSERTDKKSKDRSG